MVVCDIVAALDGTRHDAAVASTVAQEIVGAGGRAVAQTSDISTFAGGANAVRTAIDAFGRIDIVINTAGIGGGGTRSGSSAARGLLGEMGGLSLIDAT